MTYSQTPKSSHGQSDSAHSSTPVVVHVGAASQVQVPGDFLLNADYHRVASDLVLTAENGHQMVIEGFFNGHSPDLIGAGGAVVPAALATTLAGPQAPGQYAAANGAGGLGQSIGHVAVADGEVEVRHTDGTKAALHKGDEVYQGDVLQTNSGGHVGLIFADDTTFSMGDKGRMVLDEMVYDPSTHSGHGGVNVLKGAL